MLNVGELATWAGWFAKIAGGLSDKLQWKHGTLFSRIIELHKGEVFNITFSTSSEAKVDFAKVQTLHVMEIDLL